MLKRCSNTDLYWVVNTVTNRHYSKLPIPKERAEAQLRVLRQSQRSER